MPMPAAADEQAALGLAGGDPVGDRVREHRVVDRLLGGRAQVDDLVAGGPQALDQRLLQGEPGVVGAGGDLHSHGSFRSRSVRARRAPGQRPAPHTPADSTKEPRAPQNESSPVMIGTTLPPTSTSTMRVPSVVTDRVRRLGRRACWPWASTLAAPGPRMPSRAR